MRRLLVLAVVCVPFLFGSLAVAQNVCRPQPVRQRLMFRLFRRVQPSRVVARSVTTTPPTVARTCPAPIATPPSTLMPSALMPTSIADHVAPVPPAPTLASPEPTLAASEAGIGPAETVVPELSSKVPSVPVPYDLNSSSEDRVGSPSDVSETGSSVKSADGKNWRSLFDGEKLGEWKPTKFGGEGSVEVEDKQIKLDYGQYMTGVTHSGKNLPKNNYEIELEAMREDGSDFFCGLTFPVDDKHASLICGGWGGSVVGVSSIDGMDASENTTTAYNAFKNKQWYKIRVRVTKGHLQAWIDDELFVDEEVTSDRLSTRIEMDRSQPMGIACFDTQAAVRNIRIRDVKEPAKAK